MSSHRSSAPATIPIPATSTITCLCGHISTPLTQAKHTTLPIPTELCHCNSCRHTSGALAGAFIELNGSPAPDLLSRCTKYDSSSKVSRYFCPQCGSHMFIKGWSTTQPVMWFAWAGVLDRAAADDDDNDNIDIDTAKVTVQAFANDTIDGGMVGRMAVVADRNPDFPRGALQTVYADMFGEQTLSVTELCALYESSTSQSESGSDDDTLHVRCHCGTVDIRLTRPARTEAYSPQARDYIKSDNTKYLARFCACRSCRSATGLPLNAWTYVPPENIVTKDSQVIDFGFLSEDALKEMPGMKVFRTEQVRRSFCGRCGASVFYEHEERQWVVDVSIGLLRSARGALAEDWLQWDWDDVSHEEECRVKELLESVAGRKWGESRG